MDNKARPGYYNDIPDDEFYGSFYARSKKETRKLLYIYKDITIETPMVRDIRHIMMCLMNDKGLVEPDYDGPKRSTYLSVEEKIRWMFTHNKEKETMLFMFKNNEYVGYGTYIDPSLEETASKGKKQSKPYQGIIGMHVEAGKFGDHVPMIGTRWSIRPKFRKTMCAVCAIDFITNAINPGKIVLTDNKNISGLLDMLKGKNKSIPDLVDNSLNDKKYQAQRIFIKKAKKEQSWDQKIHILD